LRLADGPAATDHSILQLLYIPNVCDLLLRRELPSFGIPKWAVLPMGADFMLISSIGSTPHKAMTKSQINKLGQKLRMLGPLDTETLRKLQEFRASFDAPMFRAQTQLKQLGFEATSRLKTINTIIEKPQREKTRLAEMQDIAGLRVVSKADLTEQDRIVSMENVLNLSNDIADIEVAFVKLRRMESNLPQPKRASFMQRELRLHFAQLRSLRAYLRERAQTIRDKLEKIMAGEGGS